MRIVYMLITIIYHSRFREAELNNSRWAMLGVAGMLLQEVVTGVDWYNAGKYYAEKPGSIPNSKCIMPF